MSSGDRVCGSDSPVREELSTLTCRRDKKLVHTEASTCPGKDVITATLPGDSDHPLISKDHSINRIQASSNTTVPQVMSTCR